MPLHERQRGNAVIKTLKLIFQFMPLHERQRRNTEMENGMQIFQFMPLHERQHIHPLQAPCRFISIHAST